ncbi:S100P-binding protein [Amia ocellicauda]|uniref:S100P-binding protein n=1 Tax=Amia ocellicauda TaxID=2972642 RepID=UPI003464D2C7
MNANRKWTRPSSRGCKTRSDAAVDGSPLVLSAYSRKVICENKDSKPSRFDRNRSNPFCNIKIEIVNAPVSTGTKRQLDNSFIEDTFRSQLKKHILTPAFSSPRSTEKTSQSPDSVCVLGSCVSLPGHDRSRSTPIAPPRKKKRLYEEKNDTMESKILRKENEGVPLVEKDFMRHGSVLGGDLKAFSNVNTQVKASLSSTNAKSDTEPVFDFDIEDMLSLSPIDSEGSTDGMEEFILSCESFYNESSINKGQAAGVRFAKKCVNGGDERHTNNDMQYRKDEGYFTSSFREELKGSQKGVLQRSESPGVPEQSPLQLSSSLSPVEMNKRLLCEKREASANGKESSLQRKQLGDVVNSNSLKQENLVREKEEVPPCHSIQFDGPKHQPLGQHVFSHSVDLKDDALFIGAPLHESSIHESFPLAQVKDLTDAQKGTASERPETLEKLLASFHEEDVADDLVNNNQQSNIQVGSVVLEHGKKRSVHPTKTVKREGTAAVSTRKVVFKDSHLEHRKSMYMRCVSSHVEGSDAPSPGVMNELLSLMNTVANQGSSDSGRQWQHPSDLTRRNYKTKLGKPVQQVSLDQWQRQNRKYYCRFVAIPDWFERSSIPSKAHK